MTRARRRHRCASAFWTALLAAPGAFATLPHRPAPTPISVPGPAPAATQANAATSIGVTVVEVAGAQAYLQPGAKGGVRRGAKVVLNGKEYTVVGASDSYAVIDVGSELPREQDGGQASVIGKDAAEARQLVKPQPLARWRDAWADAEAPAKAQKPRYVPIGATQRDRRSDVRLSLAVGGMLPGGQPGAGIVSTELNARVHSEPIEAPATLDLDVSLQRWFAGNLDARGGQATRQLIWLRELLLGYRAGGFTAGLGRMRYAASTLGALDGARVSAPVGGGLSIGAFGGLLPNPLGGEPSLDAQRFGVEATYGEPDVDLRPEAALVIHGSTFGGSLDERRISGAFGIYPGLSRVGGHFEVSGFDSGNPWNAKAVELTGAGADASFHEGILQVGARLDLRQPERSRWLASFLPASWLCRTVPAPGGAPPGPEPCDGSVGTRAFGSVDAGVQVDNVSLVVGGTTVGDLTQTGASPQTAGGFVTGRVVRIAKVLRVDASASYSRATFMDMFGASAGPGLTLWTDRVDLSAYYRNATLQYRSAPTSFVEHGLGGTAMVFAGADLLLTLQGEAILGNDTHAIVFFGTVVWRPLR